MYRGSGLACEVNGVGGIHVINSLRIYECCPNTDIENICWLVTRLLFITYISILWLRIVNNDSLWFLTKISIISK